MKKYRVKLKTGIIFTILFFAPLFLPAESTPALQNNLPVHSESPETQSHSSLLLEAKNCKSLLYNSSKKRFRSQWLICISLDDKIVKEDFSGEIRLQAVEDLIDLYHHLARYSGKRSDQSKEIAWKKIKSEMAQEPLKDQRNEINGNIYNMRSWDHGDYTRLVVDLHSSVLFKIHEVKESRTLIVDFLNTTFQPGLEKNPYAIKDNEMKAQWTQYPDRVQLSFLNYHYKNFRVMEMTNPERWVIDLIKTEDVPPQTIPPPRKTIQEFIPANAGVHKIIIDPGHGGKDPGAIGLAGLAEKEVVLDIGLRLQELISKRLKVNTIMTRSADVFIPLEERTKMANDANADLFISIHANSSPQRTTRGIEVYLLGKSSDKRALRTAARENNATEEETTHLDKNLISIKRDLTQEFKNEESLELAHITRSSFMNILRPRYPVVDLGVKTAPFYVLMNTSMPSILAEVSFISNPIEEERLKSRVYRQKMAESLFDGIKKFLESNINTASF